MKRKVSQLSDTPTTAGSKIVTYDVDKETYTKKARSDHAEVDAEEVEEEGSVSRFVPKSGSDKPIESANSPAERLAGQGEQKTPNLRSSPGRELLQHLAIVLEERRLIQAEVRRYESLHTQMASQESIFDQDPELLLAQAKIKRLKEEHHSVLQVLCDLATKPEIFLDPQLKALPTHWFDAMRKLKQRQARTLQVQEDCESRRNAFARYRDELDAALVRRTDLLLDEGYESSSSTVSNASNRRDRMLEALEECISAEHKASQLVELEYNGCSASLRTAETALVKAGLMLPAPSERPDSQVRRANEAQSRTEPFRERRRVDNRSVASRNSDELSTRQTEAQDMQKIMRADLMDELHRAERARSDASSDFHKTRKGYQNRLDSFEDARRRGEMIGTKTMFDAAYFLNRRKANHKLVLAEEECERLRKEAQMIGALPEAEITSDFADRSNDGYPDSDMLAYQELTDHTKLQRWCEELGSNLETESIGSEDSKARPAGKSVAGESSHSQARYAVDKRRKLIDDWQREQAELYERMNAYRREREAFERPFLAFCGVALTAAPQLGSSRPFRAYCGVTVNV